MAHKELVIVGGPNGAGKTTFANEFLVQEAGAHYYLGADKIAYELNPEAPEKASVAAGREFSRQLRERVAAGENLIVESTLSGRTLLKAIESAVALEYSVTLLFVFVDSVDTCVARVQERTAKGGHFVPAEDVRRRYGRSLSNFWQIYRLLANHWVLAYNSNAGIVQVAFGNQHSIQVQDEDLFLLYSRLSGITHHV
jgi:predicted ABC-type ATPase